MEMGSMTHLIRALKYLFGGFAAAKQRVHRYDTLQK